MILDLLNELEQSLKTKRLWSLKPPSDRALASSAPFCYDTLRFEQWLQFILINKLRMLIKHHQPLPKNSNVAPMAQQVMVEHTEIIEILRKIDKALS